ncbi:hypothetical protein VTO42DRAFT_2691 [Malbranchea cinnamomea]
MTSRTSSKSPPSQTNRQLASAAREDTPIITRESTPPSFQSTEVNASSSTVSQEQDYRTFCQSQPQPQPQQNGQNTSNSARSDDTETQKMPWYKRAAEKYGSLELENKGSVARDHLALERTFLAWLRTSLAFASIGIAITQLFRLNTTLSPGSTSSSTSSDNLRPYAPILPPHVPFSHAVENNSDFERIRSLGKPLGATFIGIAIVVLFIGFHRYFESQYWVVRGKFPASRGSVALVAFFTAALMISSLVVILTISPSALES